MRGYCAAWRGDIVIFFVADFFVASAVDSGFGGAVVVLKNGFLSLSVGAVGDRVGVVAFADGGGFLEGVVGRGKLILFVNQRVADIVGGVVSHDVCQLCSRGEHNF